MGKNKVFVGIEIGTSKVCAMVAEGCKNGEVRLLGIGKMPSKGVRKGEIVDFPNAVKCVHEVLADVEEKSDIAIERVWAAVTGSHIVSFNKRGAVEIPEDKAEIDLEDLRSVACNAKKAHLPPRNDFLHAIIQHYYVDGKDGILDPVGMVGTHLEADFHIIHGVTTRLQNTIRCIRESAVEVEDIILSSLASAQTVLSPQQKELGAIVMDIGGGVTDYLVYTNGVIRHSGILAIGGDHITNDISIGLHIPFHRAEKLKVEVGSTSLAVARGDTVLLKSSAGFPGCEVERHTLNTIIHVRVRELFEILKRRIQNECSLRMLGAGITLSGGCSLLRGIKDLAEEIFEIPVHLTCSHTVEGYTPVLENPKLSTVIGVLKYAHTVHTSLPQLTFLQKFSRKVGTLFGKSRMLFH